MTGLQWWEAWVRQEKVGVVIVNIDPGGGRSKGVGNFYKLVPQAVLLFGVDMWVLNPWMERALYSFQHRVN